MKAQGQNSESKAPTLDGMKVVVAARFGIGSEGYKLKPWPAPEINLSSKAQLKIVRFFALTNCFFSLSMPNVL